MGLSLQLTTVEGGAALGTIGGPRSKAAKSNRSWKQNAVFDLFPLHKRYANGSRCKGGPGKFRSQIRIQLAKFYRFMLHKRYGKVSHCKGGQVAERLKSEFISWYGWQNLIGSVAQKICKSISLQSGPGCGEVKFIIQILIRLAKFNWFRCTKDMQKYLFAKWARLRRD
jgi:hypothetical protein